MDLPQLNIDDDEIKGKILNLLTPLIIDKAKCEKLVNVFQDELEKGLQYGLAGSSMQMENTFIPELLGK